MSDYDHNFFASRAARAHRDAYALARATVRVLGAVPRTVLDVGAGDGSLLVWFGEGDTDMLHAIEPHGPEAWRVQTAHGEAVIDPGREHRRMGIEEWVERREHADYDLACCIEVAEHLPVAYAGRLVDALADSADVVLWSAAHPGQGGEGHVNEQPPGYWDRLWQCRGYRRHPLGLADGASWWLRTNACLYVRADYELSAPSVVALVPRYATISDEVRASIDELRIPMLQVRGDACIDVARAELAARFLESTDATHALWLDSDMAPDAADLAELCRAAVAYQYDVLALPYVTRTPPHRLVHGVPGALPVGPFVGPVDATFVGFGATVTSRENFRRIARWSWGDGIAHPAACRVARLRSGVTGLDYFRPVLGEPEHIDLDTGHGVREYLREDQAFGRRCWLAGNRVGVMARGWAGHIGEKEFGMEDVCSGL